MQNTSKPIVILN